jgi:AcrR family transcriptional regulator
MNYLSGHPRGRGRPRTQNAESHAEIMETVYALLQEKSIRDLSMEEIAKHAGVGKQTLYKWWPTKTALVMAMFHERAGATQEIAANNSTAENAIRGRVQRLIAAFNSPLGKIMADLIAEGQSEPDILKDLYQRHIGQRRAAAIAEVERGVSSGELRADTNAGLLIDALFGAIYYRLLLKSGPLTEHYGDELVDQVMLPLLV